MTEEQWRNAGVTISNICGWLYFFAWSASFYPQPILNFRRRTTTGLTVDFPLLNVVGFSCYSISVLLLLYSISIRSDYALRHPHSPEPTVRFNDVAFGVHALLLCFITYSQFWPRLWQWSAVDNPRKRASSGTYGIIAGASTSIIAVSLIIIARRTEIRDSTSWVWLDLVYTLQYIKLFLTVFKYVPQVIVNYRRKSTIGWSIGQILFDTTGGVLSLIQLVTDSALQADWSGLTGNPVKLGLAGISLAFDIIFLVQHYLLYGPIEEKGEIDISSERSPLIEQSLN